MTTGEIIIVILLAVTLIVAATLLIFFLKNKNQRNSGDVPQLDLKEIGAIQNQIDNLSKEMKGYIELAISKEMARSYEVSNKQNETNNEKLEREI